MDVRVDVSPDEWDQFVQVSSGAHVLQSGPWGDLKAAFGWDAARLGLVDDGRLVAGGQILFKKLVGGLTQLAYVPRGPVVDWADRRLVTMLLTAMAQQARARGALVLSIEPDLLDGTGNQELLVSYGLVPSPLGSVQPQRTIMVDIGGEEEGVLAAMKSKTRYNIRLAGRKGVTVRSGSEADLPVFNRLMAETAERDSFGVHIPEYYRQAYRLFSARGWVSLLLAEAEGEPVAALMAFALGSRAWYFFGASGDAHREKMPNYLLQWEAMRWARSRGCEEYDMWGVPDEELEDLEEGFTHRRDGLWGVYRFKRGFGGRLVRTVGAWDLPLRTGSYRLYTTAVRVLGRLMGR